MRFTQAAGVCLTAFASLSAAFTIPEDTELVQRAPTPVEERKVADAACTYGPTHRACWTNGYSIATDFDQKFPTTGNTVTYDLYITNSTCNPDGNGERICMLINGQTPGPVIRATWGDMLTINVHNQMQDNGTSMHWHGVRQYHSTDMDGVGGITQCALAPGKTMTYTFQVTQFGSSWYHSHFSSQYGDGVVGAMVFDGPSSSNWDIDLGPYTLGDWYYSTAWQVQAQALLNLQGGNPPPPADNLLINGTNTNANGGGVSNAVTITTGKKYRLRLMNIAVDNFIKVSLDNHPMQIMASDFIPIKPFWAQWVLLGIGQRYDVVITANQTSGSYFFRAAVATECLSANNRNGSAIWTYSDVTPTTPTSSAYIGSNTCSEPSGIAPYWYQPVPSATFPKSNTAVGLTSAPVVPGGDNLVLWSLNTSSLDVAWDKPLLEYVLEGNTSYPARLNVYPTTAEGSWNYWLIQTAANTPPSPHPMHLHGHDFFVLGSNTGTFDASTANLNWNTPPRRDTAILPGGGWLALAFSSNNPGAWLMHCHIAWHVSEGLGAEFLEAPKKIALTNTATYNQVCSDWDAYEPTMHYQKDDSGL